MTTLTATTWQGQPLWIGTASNGPEWRQPRHGTTDMLDGRALCGAWVYMVEGRAGALPPHPRGHQEYADGSPIPYQVTCKRCLAKLATATV